MKTSLYRLFDPEDNLLYIGISCSFLTRLKQHEQDKHWSDKISTVKIERFPDREKALFAEYNAIREENPIHNKQCNNPRIKREMIQLNLSIDIEIYELVVEMRKKGIYPSELFRNVMDNFAESGFKYPINYQPKSFHEKK